jgi:hypothetical protein
MTEKLFTNLLAVGAGLVTEGSFDPQILSLIAAPERFPAILDPVFRIFLHLPIAHSYFDNMLKQNGVYQQRFARPFTR